MTTYSGRQFWPLDPRPEDICIEDIAHALSLKCRFGGHVRRFYSVAQHCVLASIHGPDRWGLLHDASEAYLPDVLTPLKPDLKGFGEIEDRVMRAVVAAFKLPETPPPELKAIDRRLLMTERRDLLAEQPASWSEEFERIEPFPWKIEPVWSPEQAEIEFMERYWRLFGQ